MKSIVSEKGQVTIPKVIRGRLGLRPGSALEFAAEDGVLVALKVQQRDPVDRVYGILSEADASAAGQSWREYRRGGGRRDRVIADFLIAAHARGHADRLLTRDRGFTRRYFADVAILGSGAPSREPGTGRSGR